MEGIIKVENISESDGQLGANIAKSESVSEFHVDLNQNDEKPKPVVLEKIPKSETEIFDIEQPHFSSAGEDRPYNIYTYSRDSVSNSDPECDPFADVDCDLSFFQKPLESSKTSSSSAGQFQIINSAQVNQNFILPSAAKSVSSKQCKTSLDTKLKCQLCLQTQSSEINLKTHVEVCAASSSHKNIRRFCVPCNKLFSTPWRYRVHARNSHGIKEPLVGRFPLKCPSCPRTFALQESLAAHLALNHKSNIPSDRAGVTSSPALVKIKVYGPHVRLAERVARPLIEPGPGELHHLAPSVPPGLPRDVGDRDRLSSEPYKCPECPSTFAKPLRLQFHVKHYHKNARRFKCYEPNCGRAFNTRSNLQDHRIRAHTDEKPFKCEALNCEKAFKTKIQLQRHMAFHSVERPFKCPYLDCTKMFASKEYARGHVPFHTGSLSFKNMPREGSFACEQCERTFYKRYLLNQHLQTHNRNDELKCPEPNCKSTFKHKHSLKLHIANIHTNPDDLRVPCPEPQCEKIFKNPKSLKTHLAYVHPKKKEPVSCKCTYPNCDKTFRTEKGVTDHLRHHTRPEECREPGCLARFAIPRDLNNHIKARHKKEAGL